MTQLTKEHFEQQLGKLATKDDLKKLVSKDDLDEKLKRLATKTDLENLEAHIDAETLVIKRELKQGFQSVDIKLDAIYEMLDVRKRVQHLEREVERLKKRPSKVSVHHG